MSKNDSVLWCLINGEDRPFPLRLGENYKEWDVADLADAVLTQRHDLGASSSINDIFLWKVTMPTSIEPEEGFCDRFPCPIVNFSDESLVTRLNERTRSVSYVFPAPAKGQLHILVQVKKPALERALKRQKLGGEVEVSRGFKLRMLWEQTWNRKEEALPWFSLRKTERDHTSPGTKDVPEYCWIFSPPNYIASAMKLNPSTVLFRDDYLRVFTKLFASSGLGNYTPDLDHNPGAMFPNPFSGVQVPPDTPMNGFILTGHPGIGKSIFLRILLVLRLCARLPTFYQVEASSTIFFSDKGLVELQPDSHLLGSYLREEPTAWALFDSTPSFTQPPDAVFTERNFVVQTPPPRSDRIEWRSKFPPIKICCLALWTGAELICAKPFQRRCIGERALIEFSEKYGYSARDTYEYASTLDEFESSFQAYCRNLSYESAVSIISNVQVLHCPDNVWHNIICITPTEGVGLEYTFGFASEYVYKCVLESLRNSQAGVAAKFYRLFLGNAMTRAPAYMLKPAAHDILSDGGSFDIIPLEGSRAGLYTHWKTPRILSDQVQTRLHITSSGISVDKDRESPLGKPPMLEFRMEEEGRLLIYWPSSKSQAGFDCDPNSKHAWVFQIITSSLRTVDLGKHINELLDRGVEKVSYVAITSDFSTTIDLPLLDYLNGVVAGKYQLRLC